MQPIEASVKATYRALLGRGLDPGEAANLTAFLHGLPSNGIRWTLPEIEGIVRRRFEHAADVRAAASTQPRLPAASAGRRLITDRRSARSGLAHVIDPPKP